MKLTQLKKIGLTSGEIKVYSALLEIGETTKTALARKSEISPSKIYDVTDRLIRKGIISSVKKKGVVHFKATDPSRLKDLIKKKEQEIDEEKKIVEDILPSLMAKYQEKEEECDVDVYYGWEGLKTAFKILENSIGKGDESLVFGASIGKSPKQGDIFWKQHQRRLDKRGYKVRIIFNEDMRKQKQRHEYYDSKPELHEVRYLHLTTLTEHYIYNDYVLHFISLKKPIGILLKNKEAVESFKQFFETLWKTAKK